MYIAIFYIPIRRIRRPGNSNLGLWHYSIIMASLLYVQWWYVTSRRGRLVDENIDPVTKSTQYRRLVFGIIVYLIAIAVSFLYIHLSVFLFALILIPAFLPNKIINRITV